MTKTITGPKGWTPGKIEHRFSSSAPLSYNAVEHSAECIISSGATVNRIYGKEILTISRAAIDLSRIPCPLLDSHSQSSIDSVLGVIESASVSAGKLHGKIRFAQTPRGKLAEAMVSRRELTGISAGYRVDKWKVTDSNGDTVDEDNIGWADDLTFTAVRWMLYEASLTGVPADMASAIRNVGTTINAHEAYTIRKRMIEKNALMSIKERMQIRQAMHDKMNDILH